MTGGRSGYVCPYGASDKKDLGQSEHDLIDGSGHTPGEDTLEDDDTDGQGKTAGFFTDGGHGSYARGIQ